jgi:general secretion pathway protein A
MYEQYFGFSHPIFSNAVAQDDGIFRNETIDRLTHDLAVALHRRDAVAILAGPSGTGKTTIAAEALKTTSVRLAFAYISHPPSSTHELLEQLLCEFGIEPYRESRVERLQAWRQYISEMAATDTRVCLLIENADELHPAILKFLNQLTVADASLIPGTNIILTTTHSADSLLEHADLAALRQRVRMRATMRPLTESEIGAYLDFKCHLAGVDRQRVFADDLGPVLHQYAGGVIRIIDNLLETALVDAAEHDKGRVSAEQLADIAERLAGLAPMSPVEVDKFLSETAPVIPPIPAVEAAAAAADLPPPDTPYQDIPTLTEPIPFPLTIELTKQTS